MLQLVEVRGQAGVLGLPIEDPSLGYDIENIEGLDPVKATLVSSSFAQQDGTQYQSSRRESRNLKLTLGLYPNYATDTVMSLRQRLYPFFMPKKPVEFRFYMLGGLTVNIAGRVESFENVMFSQDPAVDVSVVCFDPDFVDPVIRTLSGSSTSGSTYVGLDYPGTVETGVEFNLYVNRSMSEFTIYHQTPSGDVKSTYVQMPLVSGDIVRMNTVPGSKEIVLTRGGLQSSILYAVSPQSNWIQLETGTNGIRVYAEGAGVPFDIKYTRRYGGL